MPYIKPERRAELATLIGNFQAITWGRLKGLTTGDLNFLLTMLVNQWVGEHRDHKPALQYSEYDTLNSAVGALEACKLEFYRRMVAPYEDKKIAENGDVY